MLAHDGTDGVRGLVGVVKGNGGDVVVEDVSLDDAVEEVTADEATLAINGGSGAANKVPFLGVVVRESRVGVLEEGNGDEPVVHPEVGEKVPDSQVGPAKGRTEVVESRAGEKQTEIRDENVGGLLVVVERAAGDKVVDTAASTVVLALATALTLALVVVVASDVGEEVVGPADELLADEEGKGVGGSVLGELAQLVDQTAETRSLLLAGTGHKDHVALHVAGGLVVLAVGILPGEVGDEQGRVKNPASDVVDEVGIREGAVSALVGNDPETSAKETLEEGVDSPESTADPDVGDVLGGHVVVVDGKGGGEVEHVAEDVEITLEGGALEAVLGNGIANVLDGEVGRSELVAVGVNQLSVVGGLGVNLHLREGGEGCGRGRGARGVARRVGGRDSGRRLGGLCGEVATQASGSIASDGSDGSRASHC